MRRTSRAVVAFALLVAALAVLTRLAGVPSPQHVAGGDASPLADSLYRYGKYQLSNSYNVVTWRRAAESFRAAIDADPRFAPAYVALAATRLQLSRVFWEERPREQASGILELLLNAQDLDPGVSELHTELGWYYYGIARDYDQALAEHEEAIRLAPDRALAYNSYAFPLVALGRADSALAVMRHARALDPTNPVLVSTQGWIQYLSGRFEEALRTCDFVLDSLDAGFEVARDIRTLVSVVLMVRNRDSAGLAKMRRAFEADPDAVPAGAVNIEIGSAWYWAAVGDTARALAVLKVEESNLRTRPLRIAISYAAVGRMDTAFVWLDRAIEEGDPYLPEITVRPGMEPFRRDPRFPRYLERLGLEAVDDTTKAVAASG